MSSFPGHPFSNCQNPGYSTLATAMAEDDTSTPSSDSSEDSGSSYEGESSEEMDAVMDNMERTNLGGDNGMWRLKMFDASGTFRELPCTANL